MPAPASVLALVKRFGEQIDAYKTGKYNETQVRVEYIDPFFKALGWDMHNESGAAPAYQDVIHEDAIKIGFQTKAPDYCFRIGGTRKFFLEAKKPAVNIKDDIGPAFQVRRYAWSSKLSLSIVTDFEEFAVYDCRIRPQKNDKPSVGRVFYCRFEEYEQKWDEIAGIFSKEAILKGSFDKFADSTKKKKGTAEVDDAFLEEIESWREVLAKNIALRNPKLSIRELNFSVQQTIDRIIFLRICEDRGIEPYGSLQKHLNGTNVYKRLTDMFRAADDRYNSGLFHFKDEKERGAEPDTLTLALKIDDDAIKDILQNLYFPDSPYEFSVLPADILGQVYEQFLGKVIRLTDGHRAKVEEKPEVRKAGGVYYTPKYIVDYIVKNTLGTLLAGKEPKQVSKIRILDPACGSGSFLIQVYQYLLDWHRDWYANNVPEQHAKGKNAAIYHNPAGEWRLTTKERKRILLNNIYGVDIDSQAVEVTKLSLLLKVLEGESPQSLTQNFEMFHERVLPDLQNNIKCGNSLIESNYYNDKQISLIDDDSRHSINVFDWHTEFADAFTGGGFDVVIGNPPYVRPHNIPDNFKEYFWSHYSTFVKKSDLYCCFIERSAQILKTQGRFGFIISNGWLRLDSFEQLRTLLLNETHVEEVIDFTGDVFDGASVKTAILIFHKDNKGGDQASVKLTTIAPGKELRDLSFKVVRQGTFKNTYKKIFDLSYDVEQEAIKEKMRSRATELGKRFELSFGLKTGDDERFLARTKKNDEYKRLLRGENVQRYFYKFEDEYVWYRPDLMKEHRKTARPGTKERFEQPKILMRDTGGTLMGMLDQNDYYVKDVIIVSDPSKDLQTLKLLLALLNSRLMRFYYETSFPTLHVQRDELASLPVLHYSDLTGTTRVVADDVVTSVDGILALQASLLSTMTSHDAENVRRQITFLEKRIDAAVYGIFGLNKEEISLVESTVP